MIDTPSLLEMSFLCAISRASSVSSIATRPESVEQIDSKLILHHAHENATKANNYSARFKYIDNLLHEWGSVEHNEDMRL